MYGCVIDIPIILKKTHQDKCSGLEGEIYVLVFFFFQSYGVSK